MLPRGAAMLGLGDPSLVGGGLGLPDFVAPDGVLELLQVGCPRLPLSFVDVYLLLAIVYHVRTTVLPSAIELFARPYSLRVCRRRRCSSALAAVWRCCARSGASLGARLPRTWRPSCS